MDFSFTPNRLIKAGQEITAVHLLENEPLKIMNTDELYLLIKKISEMEPFKVERQAIAMTNKEVILVAGYLPGNMYKVKLENLVTVLKKRPSERMYETLFSEWQDAYDNNECNEYMHGYLLQVDEKFMIFSRNKGIKETLFEKILKSDDIPYAFGSELKKRKFKANISLKEKLAEYGIRDNSRLYNDILFIFFTFCDREDYLQVNKAALFDVIKRYNVDTLKKFLRNFLDLLSLRDLEEFKQMQAYLLTKTGDIKTPEFIVFFTGFPQPLITKFINWVNRKKIEDLFGYDERSEFWKQYEFLSVERCAYSDSVILELKDYYVVEFLGQGMGPLYFFDKSVFDKHVRRWFRIYNNSEIRNQLFHHDVYWSKAEPFKHNSPRIVHSKSQSGGEDPWERQVRILLSRYNMAKKMDY